MGRGRMEIEVSTRDILDCYKPVIWHKVISWYSDLITFKILPTCPAWKIINNGTGLLGGTRLKVEMLIWKLDDIDLDTPDSDIP
jgi:hypothetical protein